MDEQAMITRDLVLRLCANATEFGQGWIDEDAKIVVPFTAPRDTALIGRVVAAGRALGVERLLVCRTRAEFAYEPVTEVAADAGSVVHVIRAWGDEPTDLLVAVEDFSAAVLVTATTLTVAAGPPDFLRPLVGADLEAARTAFADEARASGDPEPMRAAQAYGCLERGARHARGSGGPRGPRVPGPDAAERLSVRARSVRERAPGTAAALRALRGGWAWAMLAVLLAVPFVVPATAAALPAAAGMLWLVVQLAWLSRSRTVAFATLVRVLLLGALLVWPLGAVEDALTAASGADPWVAHTYIAAWTEEAGKLLPLLLLLPFARRRFRRLAAVDFLLLAAASGAGFQAAETLLRALPAGAPATVSLPLGAVAAPELGVHFSGHGVLTGLVGAALGLAIVGRRTLGAWLWLLPVAAFALAVLQHTMFNAAVAEAVLGSPLQPHPATAVLHGLTGGGAADHWLLAVLLAGAVLLDYRTARRAADVTPPLPGNPPLGGLRRRAYGRAVRLGVRVPGDIAPLFRRAALLWARGPLRLALTLSETLHEAAVMLVAARRGPAVLAAAWRFLRERRAYAMGAARAGERPWRPFPASADLRATRRELDASFFGAPGAPGASGPAGSVPVASAGVLAVVAVSAAAFVAAVPAGGGHAAYAADALRRCADWYAALPPSSLPWVWVWAAALVTLPVAGWSVPRAYPDAGAFLREPSRMAGRVLGALAPGQVPYAVAGLAGLLLPRGSDRLLRGR
ncbi:PrsW family glutamic-type intramembrane protease [Streptomonospora salina]|uniref:RsiW-degrading membrane proteinase PrsW (M82 family) n=1 Tax=Streptomonospora salina TaxID=104205 RepID=A0A841E222_9ACTN|nr:PrsW family glutamic-type intramembrane protease [Streptomonospora salina]MBB5997857.1 RsiW-degrading membrane proteinase PrsW (M82 family) [Streptomonospora salina]